MKFYALLATAVASAAAVAVDVKFPNAVDGVVTMVGCGTNDVVKSSSEKYRVKSASVYGFEYVGREVGDGLMLGGNRDVNVDRQGPDAGWYEYRQAYMTSGEPGGTYEDVFHFGHYRGRGEFSFKEGRLFELRPVYSEIGGITLGHGESILGNTYRFDSSFQSFARNHARPLLRHRATFNSNHWNIYSNSEVVYSHDVGGRSFTGGTVSVASTYYVGKAPMSMEVSADGKSWREFASITNKGTWKCAIPADIFPAKRVLVRLRGERRASLQIHHYAFEGTVDGEPVQAYGATRYVNVETGAQYGEVKAPVFMEPIADSNAKMLKSGSGVDLWGAVSDVKVFRSAPLPKTSAQALTVSLAGNEAESVQLVVTPKAALRDVRVSPSDLVQKRLGLWERARIASSAVKVGRLTYVRVEIPTDETGARGEWPDPILPQDNAAFPVAAQTSQPFWITVRTPKGLPKGIYRGTLDVQVEYAADGRKEGISVPFEVKVFGFDLPDRTTCETAFGFSPWSVANYHGVKFGSPEHDAILEKYVQLMSDHRVSIYRWGKGGDIPVKWKDAKDPSRAEPIFDWSEFDDAHMEMRGRFGFNAYNIRVGGLGHGFQGGFKLGSICGVPQTNALYHTLMAKYLGGVERHLKEKGLLDASYVYWFDEPLPAVYPQVNTGMMTLKRHAPGIRRMLTASPSKELWDGVNLWNPRLDLIYIDAYKDVRERGDQFWWYICCGPRAPYPTEFIDHAGCELRTWLWMSWARDVTGVLIWETSYWNGKARYSDPNSPQNPYEDPMSWSTSGGTWGNGDGRFVYPPLSAVATPRAKDRKPVFDAPNPSYRLAILRDGIEDYEYFAMLKRIDPGNALLKVPESVFRNERDFSSDPSFMREHRERLAQAIERIGGDSLRLPPPAACVPVKPAGEAGFQMVETKSGTIAANRFEDRIQETLWRVRNGELDAVKVKTVALVLGTNNHGERSEDMAKGVRLVVDEIRRRRPDVKVLLYASFPCRLTWSNLRNKAANALYEKIADGKDVLFRDVNASLSLSMFTDGIRPNSEAIAVWMSDIEKCLKAEGTADR